MTSHTISSKKIKKINDKIKVNEQHIKRPSNSFMVWSQDNRTILFKENPTLKNAEISKLLGKKWNELSNDAKKIYKDKAKKVAQEHKRQYPNYIYRPKKKLATMKPIKTTKASHSCKKRKARTIKTNRFKIKPYIPLTININKPKTKHSLNKITNINTPITHNINDKMNLNINFNDNWLTYNEEYNYYEDIELFYSKI